MFDNFKLSQFAGWEAELIFPFNFPVSHLVVIVLVRGSLAWLSDQNDPRNHTNGHEKQVHIVAPLPVELVLLVERLLGKFISL